MCETCTCNIHVGVQISIGMMVLEGAEKNFCLVTATRDGILHCLFYNLRVHFLHSSYMLQCVYCLV
jgi:hypothetical protein